MGIKLTNNAFATLAASINSSATSITLTTGQGARFPTLGAGDYFYATLVDTSNNLEIVKCTARSTDVLTVVRAQESTTARAYNTGDRIEIRITAQTFIDATTFTPTPASVSDQDNTSTGYFDLPSGTTAQRPGTPTNGMARYNTTLGKFEVYENGAWTSYSVAYTIEYLVVAGGGGGAGGYGGIGGGGGGAGGYIDSSVLAVSGTSYSLTVGGGGAGAGGSSGTVGTSGSNSTFSTLATAIGGGGAASYNGGSSQSGGSGGGGTYSTQPAGSGTAGQGFAGGAGSASANAYGGGGGGGALNQGVAASGTAGGAGGVGINWKSIGTYYADGGGGGVCNNIAASTGGSGTGGAGASGGPTGGTAANGGNATANRGSGGGGGANNGGNGGSGSSGVVIVRYAGSQKGTGGTVTSSGGYTYHTFTSSGTFTA